MKINMTWGITEMSVQDITQQIIRGHWSNDELDTIVNAVKFVRGNLQRQKIRAIQLGDQVSWHSGRNPMGQKGRVEKIGRKFITVNTGQMRWRVPANMLTVAA